MAITIASAPDLLRPGVNAVFGDYANFEAEWPAIFEKNTSEMSYEIDVETKLLGLAQLRAEGAATSFEDAGERYKYVYQHVGVALGFVMTKFAMRDNLYKTQFMPNAKALKSSMLQTKEVYGAAVLNLANISSGAGDGVALLSTAHPIDSGTVANTFTVPVELSETALQDAYVGVRRFKDAAGLRKIVKADKLIIPPELMWVAKRLLETDLRVGTSDNDINALKAQRAIPGGYVINDFLTNIKSWYLKTSCEDGFKFFQRDPLEITMHTDFTSDNMMTKTTERYSFGSSNFRCVFGCMP
jgi:hypothetical protein